MLAFANCGYRMTSMTAKARHFAQVGQAPGQGSPLIPQPSLTLPALQEAVTAVAPSRLPEMFTKMQEALVRVGEEGSQTPIHMFYREWAVIVEIERFPEVGRRLHAAEREGGVTVRTPTTACRRPIGQVHDSELDLALRRVVADAAGISADELTVRVARIYGWERRGFDISVRLSARIAALLDSGTLRGTADSLTTPHAHGACGE